MAPDDVTAVLVQVAEPSPPPTRRASCTATSSPGTSCSRRRTAVKLTDFGIAKAVGSATVTATGFIVGTAQYLAPEQATGGTVSPASDVYSLGVVAFEMLSGRPPFTGDSHVAVAMAQVHDPPPALPASVPAGLAAVVRDSMAKAPAQRPADGAAVAARLRATTALPFPVRRRCRSWPVRPPASTSAIRSPPIAAGVAPCWSPAWRRSRSPRSPGWSSPPRRSIATRRRPRLRPRRRPLRRRARRRPPRSRSPRPRARPRRRRRPRPPPRSTTEPSVEVVADLLVGKRADDVVDELEDAGLSSTSCTSRPSAATVARSSPSSPPAPCPRVRPWSCRSGRTARSKATTDAGRAAQWSVHGRPPRNARRPARTRLRAPSIRTVRRRTRSCAPATAPTPRPTAPLPLAKRARPHPARGRRRGARRRAPTARRRAPRSRSPGPASSTSRSTTTSSPSSSPRSPPTSASACRAPTTRSASSSTTRRPNVAKEMHVGHLRTTVIGDALVRMLDVRSATRSSARTTSATGARRSACSSSTCSTSARTRPRDELVRRRPRRLLQAGPRRKFDADDGVPGAGPRSGSSLLQSGDPETLRAVAAARRREHPLLRRASTASSACCSTDDDLDGRERLQRRCCPRWSTGSTPPGCCEDERRRRRRVPARLHQPRRRAAAADRAKRDGGFNYAHQRPRLRHRPRRAAQGRRCCCTSSARRRRSTSQMVFAVAEMAGWLQPPARAVHVAFGNVLGPDRKMLQEPQRRDASSCIDLLDEAVERADAAVAEKNPDLPPDERAAVARAVGIGAVKYADLSTDRIKDYVFDWDRMLSFDGNTAPVPAVRPRPHLLDLPPRRASTAAACAAVAPDARRARRSGRSRCGCSASTPPCATPLERYSPHRLCTYLFDLAQDFTAFYEACPVLRAPDDADPRTAAWRCATSPPGCSRTGSACSASTRRSGCEPEAGDRRCPLRSAARHRRRRRRRRAARSAACAVAELAARARHAAVRLRRGTTCAPAAARRSTRSATGTSSTRPRRSCAWPWPASPTRRGCCSTSPPAASCTSPSRAGVPAERAACCTATTRASTSCAWRSTPACGHIVVDSFDELDRLERAARRGPARRRASCCGSRPGVHAHTHEFIATGQDDSKFGFNLANGDAGRGGRAGHARSPRVDLVGVHCHIGSQRVRGRRASPRRPR